MKISKSSIQINDTTRRSRKITSDEKITFSYSVLDALRKNLENIVSTYVKRRALNNNLYNLCDNKLIGLGFKYYPANCILKKSHSFKSGMST